MEENKEVLVERMVDNLPVLRRKLRLSQESLAEIIGTSRYTILQIETKKRKMTWNTFMSLLLLFEKNEATAVLLRALGIYTDALDAYFRCDSENQR